jgi:CHASE2 domain-containing sensor protein
MGSRDQNSLVADWMEASWLIGIGAAGVILVVLGLRRDDIVGTVFLVVGLALAAIGFGSHFLGWEIL